MLKIKGLYLPMLADRICTGDVYFLNSSKTNTNDDPGNGKDPDKPFSTLDYAQSKMTSANDDVLVIGANHSETITGAGGITCDVADSTILGLGRYNSAPTFLMDGATTVTCLVTSDNVVMENLIFKAGHADIAIWGHIAAKGCGIIGCRFIENAANENWVDIIHAGTADNDYDGLELINNSFIMDDAACVTAIDLLTNSADVTIAGNRITGDFDASPYAPIYSASTEIHKNILVSGNLIHNAHNANAVVGISIANTATTGWMVNNHVGHADVAGETPFLGGAAGIYVGLNYASGVRGTASGYLLPAVDS